MAERTRWLLWISLFAAAVCSCESWILGPYSWMYGYGAGLETVPTHLALHYGDRLFSTWAPFVAGGVDRYAFWGNADPLNVETLFLGLFPTWLGVGLHRFTQYAVAIFFAARLARDELGLEERDALAAGLFYGAFSYFTFGEMLALPALPLFLWALSQLRLREERRREQRRGSGDRSGFWLAVGVGLIGSTLTTFTHSVPYIGAFLMLWTLSIAGGPERCGVRSWSAFWKVVGVVIGLSIGDAPQLFSALAQAPLSHREAFPPEQLSWTLDGLLYRQLRFDYFNQDPFAKQLAWNLPLPFLSVSVASVALLRWRRGGTTALERKLFVLYALYLGLSQRWLFVGVQAVLGTGLPWLHGVFMGRFFDVPASLLIALQLALLLAVVRRAAGDSVPARRFSSLACGLIVGLLILRPKLFLFYRSGVDDWGQENYQVAALDELRETEVEPFRVASVLPLQPAYAYAQGIEAADGWANLYPRHYREYWLRILSPLFEQVPGAKEIFDPDTGRPQDHYIFLGADLLHPIAGRLPGEEGESALVRALEAGFDVDRRFDLEMLGLLNVKYLLSELPLRSERLELVHAIDPPPSGAYSRDWATGRLNPESGPRGTGWVEVLRNAIRDWKAAVSRRRAGKDVYVYRLRTFVERFRFVPEVHFEADPEALLARLSAATLEELRKTSFAMRPELAGPFSSQARVREVVNRGSSEVVLDVEVPEEAFLTAAMTWSPYWRGTADAAELRLVRVNHTQIGFRVPAGTRRIRLWYAPPYLPSWLSSAEAAEDRS